jgi:hypothetical protein
MDRRSFIGSSTALAALAAGSRPAIANPTRAPSAGRLESLGRSLSGRLILPGDTAYRLASWPNNARWADVAPLAVAACRTPADVQLCLRWAREEGQRFAVRSGGHNYAGFSTTNGLLIDVRPMNSVRVDLSRGIAEIGAGANNQDMANAFRHTVFSVPSGRCPTVGVAGLTLGGGWGFSATHAGLTCDSLLASEVVLADATQVNANAAGETADLFWALQGGGGGNFGINTSFTFRLREVSEDVTIFNIVWPGTRQVEMLSTLLAIQAAHPTRISTRTKTYPQRPGSKPARNEIVVATLGQFFGPRPQALEALAPALGLVKPLHADIRQMPYWQARDYLITDDPNGLYDLRSAYVAGSMPGDGLETMIDWITRWPGGSLLPENVGLFFAIGGKVRERAIADSAYPHRNADWILQIEHAWAPIDPPDIVRAQQEWLIAYFEAMQRWVLPQSYVNFPSRGQPDWARAYYGPNLGRLQAIKRRLDPDNLFRFEQSIPPA